MSDSRAYTYDICIQDPAYGSDGGIDDGLVNQSISLGADFVRWQYKIL